MSEALGALALGGSLTTLGYSASREATIDLTNLIWQRASIKSFILFAQAEHDENDSESKCSGRDRQHHRFRAAGQLTTTVMGAEAELSGAVETLLTRNRLPSAVTS